MDSLSYLLVPPINMMPAGEYQAECKPLSCIKVCDWDQIPEEKVTHDFSVTLEVPPQTIRPD